MSEGLDRLVELVARLRDPQAGCPWDREQDHVSLRPYVIEEAYEVVAAIDGGSPAALAGELGDLLLQVLLHARLGEESGDFSLDDVFASLEAKLIRRHPHVFGDAPRDLTTVRERWDEIKRSEPCSARAPVLPTLLAARKSVSGTADLSALRRLAASGDAEERAGADLLLRLRELWTSGIDADIALRKAMAAVARAEGAVA